ncbi:carbohydrate kinase family protein [Microbacterium sp. YY-03]|uniref:carbohydrate kinase family protein n=1 Tax=Microbacterium sp. YY-03 TaxID=3421636 RepID=UPI003D182F3A
MADSPARVVIFGPASWNEIVLLDHLPEPVPHMQFAQDRWHAVGGTSAGKALHLTSPGLDVELHTLLASDGDGRRVADALRGAGVTVMAHEADRTERHLNLMTPAGERVSLYLATPSLASAEQQANLLTALRGSDHAVIDLTETGRSLIAQVRATPTPPTIWVDLHDYDGAAEFHEPFLRNADIVFMNGDATDDPESLIRSCVERGPKIAVCTLGAHGAIAVADDGVIVRTAAEPIDHIVDTNGAGDAFMAGFLAAHISGVPLAESLRAGGRQALAALQTKHLHPALAD